MTNIQTPTEFFDAMKPVIFTSVERAAADGHINEVKGVAIWAATYDKAAAFYCDGCGNAYDREIIEIAEEHDLPTTVQGHDSNGDPDVAICGWCVLEDRDAEPPDYEGGYIHDTPDNVGDYEGDYEDLT